MTPEQRRMRAQVGAHAMWAKTDDRSERTAVARKKFLDRFEKQVDPNGELTPAERATRAASARRAYFASLALRSSLARAARKKPA